MKPSSIGIGFSHQRVPSLSNTATRSSGGTSRVAASTNSTIACRVALSCQDASSAMPVTGALSRGRGGGRSEPSGEAYGRRGGAPRHLLDGGAQARGAKPRGMPQTLDQRMGRWYERLTPFRAVRLIVATAVALVLVAGLLERLVEPETFTSLGISYWWAVVTVTTVGYGDVVPHSPAGRVVGGMLMLVGLSLIPTLTSVVVSVLLSKRQRADRALFQQEQADEEAALTRIEDRLERIESRIGGSPR
jgi:hypothetical protein